MAATPSREVFVEPGSGLVTTLHCTPSQCSISVLLPPNWPPPTAQTSVAEIIATALRTLPRLSFPFGLGTTFHVPREEETRAQLWPPSIVLSSTGASGVVVLIAHPSCADTKSSWEMCWKFALGVMVSQDCPPLLVTFTEELLAPSTHPCCIERKSQALPAAKTSVEWLQVAPPSCVA